MEWIIIGIVAILMLFLGFKDFQSTGDPNHKDFKSSIVSLGILGTFTGIFWGLLDFDTSQVTQSIPPLLEGLKFAFATSIFGMLISVVLSIYQKFIAKGSANDDTKLLSEINQKLSLQLDQLNRLQRLDQLDQLQHLHSLTQSNQQIQKSLQPLATLGSDFQSLSSLTSKLDILAEIAPKLAQVGEITPKLDSLIKQVYNFRKQVYNFRKQVYNFRKQVEKHQEELVGTLQDQLGDKANDTTLQDFQQQVREGQKTFTKQIEGYFEQVKDQLNQAIETLSKGATEEIIKALENVIADFNNNLTEQFGDNFKQLNQSVLNLIKWQEDYKSTITESNNQLQRTVESLDSSQHTLEKVAQRNEQVQQVYQQLQELINTYHIQVESLNELLQSHADLGNKASESFKVLDYGFNKILEQHNEIATKTSDFSETIQKNIKFQTETLNTFTEELSQQLPDSLGELEKTLVGLTAKFRDDYQAFLNKVNELLLK